MPHGMHIFIPSRPFLVRAQSLSYVQLSVIPWAEAHQVPLSIGFPRQEYWSGLPFPPPGDLPKPRIKPRSLQADAEPRGKPASAIVLSNFSHIRLFVTPWTVVCQAPLSLEFSRKEYWSGLPCPSPGDLPNPGKEPAFLLSLAPVGKFFTSSATWEAQLEE